MSWRKPVLYQESAVRRRRVEGSYRLASDGTVKFEGGVYDRSKPLVIDPVLSYMTYVGRSFLDITTKSAVDASGNTYLTGATQDVNLVGFKLVANASPE